METRKDKNMENEIHIHTNNYKVASLIDSFLKRYGFKKVKAISKSENNQSSNDLYYEYAEVFENRMLIIDKLEFLQEWGAQGFLKNDQ
jgi:hypothetical protein